MQVSSGAVIVVVGVQGRGEVGDVDRATVDQLYAKWKTFGVAMELEPTELDFGYTFVAAD